VVARGREAREWLREEKKTGIDPIRRRCHLSDVAVIVAVVVVPEWLSSPPRSPAARILDHRRGGDARARFGWEFVIGKLRARIARHGDKGRTLVSGRRSGERNAGEEVRSTLTYCTHIDAPRTRTRTCARVRARAHSFFLHETTLSRSPIRHSHTSARIYIWVCTYIYIYIYM